MYIGFPYNKVVTKTLHLLVLDYDRFSRDDPIGEVCLSLGDLDLAAGLTMWKTLMPCKGSVVSADSSSLHWFYLFFIFFSVDKS